MKRKKESMLWPVFLVCLLLLCGWSVWNAFLKDIIPRHITHFWSYEAFRNKSEHTLLALQLPKSAKKIKYYWSVDRFVYVAGYSIFLPKEEYEQMKEETIERYKKSYEATKPLPNTAL